MKYALLILIVFTLFTLVNAQPNVFIKNVPDYSQPPDSTVPSSWDLTNYCAPYAFLNIVEYWDSVQTQPFARGLMGGLPGKDIVEYIGWFMDTNNQGSPARENDNGRPAAPGTYVMDQWHGAEEFIFFDASQTFLFPYTVPLQKNRYTWDIQFVPVPDFLIFKDEIDLGNPVKLDFRYWNIIPTGGSIYDPELAEDTIFVYDWGAMVDQSGTGDERDPVEAWNLLEGDAGIGHAVTAVGYLENYVPPDTNYVIVRDNWANTPKNIAIPWIDANITGWFSYHLSEPPDLAVTNIQTANDTSLGFTDSLQVHKPVTVAATIHNLGSGGAGAGQYMCTTSVLDPLGSLVITNRKHPQTILYPQGAGQDSIIVYFDSLFTPTMTGGYDITSAVYWDMNGDSLENDSPEPNQTNDTLVITAQVYINTNLPINVPDDFATIQEAIDASSDGNTVLVDEGTYYENINFKGKAITVASHFYLDGDTSHISNTIIDGSQPTDPAKASVVTFETNEDTTSVLMGFTITGGKGTLYDAVHKVGGGIFCKNSGARIEYNKIIFNSVSHGQECLGGGIGSFPRQVLKHLIIENNLIESNSLYGQTGSLGGGIFIDQGRIAYNKISDNLSSGGASYIGWGGGIGLSCDTTIARTLVMIVGNNITNNQATSGSASWGGVGGGVAVDFCNVLLIENQITYNKTRGAQPYASGVTLLSVGPSMIKGNNISFNTSVGTSGDLSGLGGGLSAQMTIDLIIRENDFEGNEIAGGGGITTAYTEGTVMSDNTFLNNRCYIGGGIYELQTVGTIISDNRFIGNWADYYGGGICVENCSPQIYNNLIVRNKASLNGGGIYLGDETGEAQIINNTIAEDTAGIYGGGICADNVSPIILNTILWNNYAPSAAQIYSTGENTKVVYCDVQDTLWPGEGNKNIDPYFCIDTLFCLSDSSQCIDAGDPNRLDPEDPINNGIPLWPAKGTLRSDMGVYGGYQLSVFINNDENELAPTDFILYQNYPNPFNPVTVISWQLPVSSHVDLSIYNILGQKVATLVDKKEPAGTYNVEWDASGFTSGIYYYKLNAGDYQQVKKMVLIK